MPKPPNTLEIEIKLQVHNINVVKTQLKNVRARKVTPRTHELNTLYDTPSQNLRRRGRLIRVRLEHPAEPSPQKYPAETISAILTYKGPAPSSPSGVKGKTHSKNAPNFKIKDEAEVSVTNPDNLVRILQALGLRPSFRYEKFRTTYALPSLPHLKIELDETPVGIFLELEGPKTSIDRAARLLGYTRKDYSTDSYGALYLADCRRRGKKPTHMLFPPTKNFKKPSLLP